jgi:hypothetical protein
VIGGKQADGGADAVPTDADGTKMEDFGIEHGLSMAENGSADAHDGRALGNGNAEIA